MATDKTKHLDCVLSSHSINKEADLLAKFKTRRKEVKEALEEEFGKKLYSPFDSGSYAKNTAVNTKFDFDLMAPFTRKSFATLEEMFDEVFKFLKKKFETDDKVAFVRKQKVSIGIDFHADEEGDIVKIDAVPGRELIEDKFTEDKRLNLNVYEQFGNIKKGSDYIQTNIHDQIDNIKNRATTEKDSIRKVIRLLKVWKIQRGYGPKSFFLELITIKAFDSKMIKGSTWDKLKSVLEYIKDNVESCTLVDPGNSNNKVSETLTDSEKTTLSNDMKNMLDRIEENDDNIKTYFKVNSKFPCAEDNGEKNQYGGNEFSVPPVTRFG